MPFFEIRKYEGQNDGQRNGSDGVSGREGIPVMHFHAFHKIQDNAFLMVIFEGPGPALAKPEFEEPGMQGSHQPGEANEKRSPEGQPDAQQKSQTHGPGFAKETEKAGGLSKRWCQFCVDGKEQRFIANQENQQCPDGCCQEANQHHSPRKGKGRFVHSGRKIQAA